MKRLFYLIALLAVAFACQATPTIPTVGATIPSGDKNDGAPGTVFQLCKRTYKAARINDNGGLSNFEGSNYLEVYIEGKYPDECSFHGMMGGIEPKWVTPIDAEGLFFSRLFYEGQKIGCLSDGTPIYIYILLNLFKYGWRILHWGSTTRRHFSSSIKGSEYSLFWRGLPAD